MLGLQADRMTLGQVFVGKLGILPDGIIPAVVHTRRFIKNWRLCV